MLILAGRPVLFIINLQELHNAIFNSLWPTIATFFSITKVHFVVCALMLNVPEIRSRASSPQIATSFP